MTLQIAEKLIYKDVEFYIGTYPLETYLAEKQICFNWESTACMRGYNGTWLIEDDKLFLIDLSATIIKDNGMWKWPFEYVEVGLDYLFPNQEKVMDGIGEAIFGVDRSKIEPKKNWLNKFLDNFR